MKETKEKANLTTEFEPFPFYLFLFLTHFLFQSNITESFLFQSIDKSWTESNIDDVKFCQGYQPGLHSTSFVFHLNRHLSSCYNAILFPSIQWFSITFQAIVWLHK